MVSSVDASVFISSFIVAFLSCYPIIAGSSSLAGDGIDRSHQTVESRLERSLFSSCTSEQSEISENTIIRTKDSRALGARFLNGTSLGSDARDKCLALCCAFHGCNVAVYEEKDGGNCYLFDCGPTDDFRCKFTSHSHYTSGVIHRRENAHEEELTQLKKISVVTAAVATTVEPIMIVPPTVTSSSTAKPTRTCSRYQFECHTTGECIAIYNACDGIIQCSDGSDEAPELGCPATTTEFLTTKMATTAQLATNINKSPIDSIIPVNNGQQQQQQQHPASSDWRANRGDRDRFAPDPLNGANSEQGNRWRVDTSGRNYGDRMRVPYQSVVPDSGVFPSETDRSINPYYNPDVNNHHYGPNYGRDQERTGNEYRSGDSFYGDRYNNYESNKEVRLPYDAANNVYPSRKQQHDWERNGNAAIGAGPVSPVENRNPLVDRTFAQQRFPAPLETLPEISPPRQLDPPSRGQSFSTVPEVKIKVLGHSTASTPPTVAAVETTTTATLPVKKAPSLITKDAEAVANHAHINRFHVNQVDFQEERAERSRQTVGAVWALTLGLSVTAVLVLLVGCRLRSLKRHLHRGRGGHARDADYLVNGMYL